MIIKDAKFVKGIIGTDNILKDSKKHFAFIGRSNVGKSSVINSLTKKGLVKSSSLPGKTREINFFLINDDFYFVDLPGYGFAKINPKQREKLRKLILWYLFSEETSVIDKKIILIIDFKVGPTDFDIEVLNALKESNLDFLIIANKIDKIGKTLRNKQIKEIQKITGDEDVILYSAKTKEGKDVLSERLFK